MSPVRAPDTTCTVSPLTTVTGVTLDASLEVKVGLPVLPGSQPMKLRATEAPRATPTPAAPPATAAATASTFASMAASLVALIVMSPPLSSEPPSTWALTFVRMMLVACAPAPLTPTATRPTATDSEAAAVHALICAASSAAMLNGPDPVTTAFTTAASTALSMRFHARATPMPIATPTFGPNEAAIDAAPVTALIREVSRALIVMLATGTVSLPIVAPVTPPSTDAVVCPVIELRAAAPDAPTAPPSPTATAIDPASTRALMTWLVVAWRVRSLETV